MANGLCRLKKPPASVHIGGNVQGGVVLWRCYILVKKGLNMIFSFQLDMIQYSEGKAGKKKRDRNQLAFVSSGPSLSTHYSLSFDWCRQLTRVGLMQHSLLAEGRTREGKRKLDKMHSGIGQKNATCFSYSHLEWIACFRHHHHYY